MTEAVQVMEDVGAGILVGARYGVPLADQKVSELRVICRAIGITGYSAMTKAEIVAAIEQKEPAAIETRVATQAPVLEAVVDVPAEPQWGDGFIAELRKVILDFDALDPTHFLPEDLESMVSRVTNGMTVDAFDDLNDEAIMAMISALRNNLPKYQREVYEVIRKIANARAIAVEVDFI